MIIFKLFIYSIYFLWSSSIVLQHVQISSVANVFLTYSGINALILHMSIYLCVMLLGCVKYLNIMNSESVIRMNVQTMKNKMIITIINNTMVVLIALYGIGSYRIVSSLGWSYFIENQVIAALVISIIFYLMLYLAWGLIYMILYLKTDNTVLALIACVSMAFVSTFVFKGLYVNICVFEPMYWGEGISLFNIFKVIIVLYTIIILIMALLENILRKRDYIYENEV